MSREFCKLMRHAKASDWLSLLHFDSLRQCVYLYDVANRAVHHPQVHEVEWPIIWVLARYHKKFIWSTKLPSEACLIRDFAAWRNRIAWKWFFRQKPGSKPPFRPCVDADSVPFKGVLNKDIQSWLQEVQRRIACRLRHDIESSRSSGRLVNTIPLTTFGLQRLKHSKFGVVPTDKDGGFAVLQRDQLQGIHRQIFAGEAYRPCVLTADDQARISQKYVLTCRQVAACYKHDPKYLSLLLKSSRRSRATMFANLGITVKSHKPEGQVKCRNLHKIKRFAFEGLSAWVDHVLQPTISSMPHILANSEQFARRVGGTPICTGSVLVLGGHRRVLHVWQC